MFGITENSFTFALTKQKDKMVTITYNHINHGENNGKIEILSDGQLLEITDYAKDGWSTCYQENTCNKVIEIAKKHFSEFLFTECIDGGSGYVYKVDPYVIKK